MEHAQNKKLQTGLLIVLAAIAVFFSTYKLTEAPSFWYDEGWYFQHSANLVTTGVDGLQFAPGDIRHLSITTVAYPLIYPMALWMKVFGVSVGSARSLMALFILGLLAAAYFLSRRLFGPIGALVAVALLAVFPPLYANGKSMLGEVPGLLYLTLSLFFLDKALNGGTRRRLFISLAGLFIGLCAVTKPIFILAVP